MNIFSPSSDDDINFSTRRVEALTDGVFAIAMTLLVLELKLDQFKEISTNAELWSALASQQEGVISFMASFLLLGSMWAIHMRQYEYISKTDRHLTMINTIRLLVVVLMPLAASISGAYPDVMLARVMLPLSFLALAVVSYWQWNYATDSKNKLASSAITERIKHEARIKNRAVISVAILVTLAAAFVGQIAFVLLLLMVPSAVSFIKRREK